MVIHENDDHRVFEIDIALATDEDSEASSLEAVVGKNVAAHVPPCILVADDDLEILSMVTLHLKKRDVRILEASDGEEAMTIARKEKPNAVILDVMMPGMTGWEVCRAIREDSSLGNPAIIMLTGIGERLNEMTSPLYGADDYLDKPFDFSELDAKVRSVLAKKNLPYNEKT